MAHAQKPGFVFRRNGRVNLNRRRRQSSRLLAAEVCASPLTVGSNAGYTLVRGSEKGTGYPLHSPVSPSLLLPLVAVCHHISTGGYLLLAQAHRYVTFTRRSWNSSKSTDDRHCSLLITDRLLKVISTCITWRSTLIAPRRVHGVHMDSFTVSYAWFAMLQATPWHTENGRIREDRFQRACQGESPIKGSICIPSPSSSMHRVLSYRIHAGLRKLQLELLQVSARPNGDRRNLNGFTVSVRLQ